MNNLCDEKIQINYRSIISRMTRDRGICQLAQFIISCVSRQILPILLQTVLVPRESQPKNIHTQQAGFEDRMLEVEREREGPSVMSA